MQADGGNCSLEKPGRLFSTRRSSVCCLLSLAVGLLAGLFLTSTCAAEEPPDA